MADLIQEHHEILGRSGRWVMTGETALVPPSDPDLAGLGILEVWSKTAEGVWIHVAPHGAAVEAACPFGD